MSWGCPHDLNGQCARVKGRPCDPGMKGCVLYGRFVFSNEEKNPPPKRPYEPKKTDGDYKPGQED